MFYGIWNVVQYFLPPKTREKVCPQISSQGCLQYVEPQYLPVTMGGTSRYEPDIENIEDPPPVIHSVLYKTKKLTDSSRHTGKSPPLCTSSTLPKIGDYRSVSVSIDMNENEDNEEGGGDLYAESEFGDDYSSMVHDSPSGSSGSPDKLMKLPQFQLPSKFNDSSKFCPAMMRGWGMKQGHIIKNWKRRYFILTSDREVTLLRYFKYEQSYAPYGDYLCGELNLQYYHLIPSERQISFDSSEDQRTCHCLELVGNSSLDKDLLICIEDSADYQRWIGALEAHIDYRKEIEEIAQEANAAFSMWKCVLL